LSRSISSISFASIAGSANHSERLTNFFSGSRCLTTLAGFPAAMVFGGIESGENVVYKILSNGIDEWDYQYNGEYNTMARAATETSDANIVITDNSFYGSLQKLNNSTGDTIWTETSNYNNEYPRYTNLKTTSDNALIITGYTDGDDLILVKALENGSLAGINDHNNIQNSVFLDQNYPNPLCDQTYFNFSMANDESLELYITDENGKRIRTIFNKSFSARENTCNWDGNNYEGVECPSGIYYAVLKTNKGIVLTRKLIKQKK